MDLPDPHRLHNALFQLSPNEFERFVAEVWGKKGWDSTVTRQSNDYGIDVLASRSDLYDEKAAIQAKCYSPSNKVGRPEIQQYDSIRRQDSEIDVVIVVTTSSFTGGAQQLANQLNVKLIDGEDLTSAVLESLSYERIFDLVGEQQGDESIPEKQEDKSSARSHPDVGLPYQDISREELTDVECELADIYQSHWEERADKYNGTPASSLVFKFEKEPEELEFYQVLVGLHSIEFAKSKRRARAAKTVKKHNWQTDENRNSVSSVGESLSGPLTDSLGPTILNVKPNGEIGESLNAEFEARFTTIVLEQFLDSSFANVSHIETLPFDSEPNPRKYTIDSS
jgi:hypothetical protein